MKITKQDLQTLGLLIKYEANPTIVTGTHTSMPALFYKAGSHEIQVIAQAFETLTDGVIETLAEYTPKEGTPNSEITDEQKGMIQLLFEIEKVLV
jgi:hypothetical protein